MLINPSSETVRWYGVFTPVTEDQAITQNVGSWATLESEIPWARISTQAEGRWSITHQKPRCALKKGKNL
jgi:hypothetical protein